MCSAELIERQCGECSESFTVCKSCWRGQRYCADGCRHENRAKRHRGYQKTYRQTEAGREQHARTERERRERRQPWFIRDQRERAANRMEAPRENHESEVCQGERAANRKEAPRENHESEVWGSSVEGEDEIPMAEHTSKEEPEKPTLKAEIGKTISRVENGDRIGVISMKRCRFCGRRGKVVGVFSP